MLQKIGMNLAGLMLGLTLIVALTDSFAQTISFTSIPPLGSTQMLQGKTTGIDPSAYGVALMIDVFDTWWTKPLFTTPIISISSNGTFQSTITTGGQDPCAGEIAAFAVPLNYAVPILAGSGSIPQEIYANSVAHLVYDRVGSLNDFTFASRDWTKKTTGSGCVWGPGPNYFGSNNALVSNSGSMVLTINNQGGTWYCAEAILKKSLGYGSYRFWLKTDPAAFPTPVVLGLFVYDDDADYSHREIDIEFSNGNIVGSPNNWQNVIQPYNAPGQRFQFSAPDPMPESTHVFHWTPNNVSFQEYSGIVSNLTWLNLELSSDLKTWTQYTNIFLWGPTNATVTFPLGADDHKFFRASLAPNTTSVKPFHTQVITNGVPPAGNERVHINLWLDSGTAPSSTLSDTYQVEIADFAFVPLMKPDIEVVACDEKTTTVLISASLY